MASTRQHQDRLQGLEKRKACDLCHIKKIKCDAKKPTCSHCVVYEAQCTYTPFIERRRKDIKHRKKTKSLVNAELRLAQLETKVHGFVSSLPNHDSSPALAGSHALPSFADLLPIIEDYFRNFNSTVPLFRRTEFIRMLAEQYSNHISQDLVAWAAINVVLALSQVYRATDKQLAGSFDSETCTKNAKSVLDSIITRDQDLIGLQVLLGLVMLLQGTPRPTLASAFLATAVKLMHRLRIHEKQNGQYFDNEMAVQRDRLFWITYILDRDISMRLQEPYMHHNNHTDIDIPISSVGNGMFELLSDKRDKVSIDFFRTRVQLSRIQGEIYDSMFSVQAEKVPASEQQISSRQLIHTLEGWIRAIPAELQPDRLLGASPGFAARQFMMMYFTYFSCFFMAHRVCSHDAEWISRLVDYSQRYTVGYLETASNSSQFLLPPSWLEIVGKARACMKLFGLVDRSDLTLLSTIGCTYVSALIVVIVNNLTLSEHGFYDHVDGDTHLISEALKFLEWVAEETGHVHFHKLHAACDELSCRARVARTRFISQQQMTGSMAPALAWLEVESIKSASYSALTLVEVFTQADEKLLSTRILSKRRIGQ